MSKSRTVRKRSAVRRHQDRVQASRRAVQRDERRERKERRQRLRRSLYVLASAVIAFLIIGSFVLSDALRRAGRGGPSTVTEGPGQHFPIQGFEHIAEGTPITDYSTVPPTSGPHWQSPALWGVSTEPIPNERQVHNLEHGGVLIQYNTQDAALIAQLTAFAGKQALYPCWVLVAPYPNMTYAIALTAWGAMDTMEAYDEARLQAFTDAYRNRGPEKTSCTPEAK